MPVGEERRRAAVEGVGAADGSGFEAGGAHHTPVAVLHADVVQGLVELDALFGVVEQVDLKPAAHEVTVADPDEPHAHALVEQLFEEILGRGHEVVVGGSVGDAPLHALGREVGVANLDGDAGSELVAAPQLEGQVFCHGEHDRVQFVAVGGVLGEGAFGRDRFAFVVGDDRRVVQPVRLLPNRHAILAQHLLDELDGHVLKRPNRGDAEVAQGAVGFRSNHGDFPDRERAQKMPLRSPAHAPGVVGLRLARRHFRHSLAGAEPYGNGQARLADDALPKLAGELPAPKEPVHSAEVRVEFVDGTLFTDRHGLPHDVRHDLRLLGIGHGIPADHHCFRAQRPGHLHGHPGVHPKPPRLVTAGRHHASIARPPNQDGPAFEA